MKCIQFFYSYMYIILRVPSADSMECDAFYIVYHIKQF